MNLIDLSAMPKFSGPPQPKRPDWTEVLAWIVLAGAMIAVIFWH